MRFIGRRDGRLRRAARADGLGRGDDGRQRPDHAVRGVQLRRAGGDRRRGANASPGDDRGGVPRAPLRARDARPRPDHPHQRRAAAVQLPAVAVAPTPSSCSATSCGPTSTARRSRLRWPSTQPRSGASAAADGHRVPAATGAARPRRAARRGARRSDLRARLLVARPRDRLRDLHRRCRAGWSSRWRCSCSGCVCLHELYAMLERRAPGRARRVPRAGRAGRRRRYYGRPVRASCWCWWRWSRCCSCWRSPGPRPGSVTLGDGGDAVRRVWIGLAFAHAVLLRDLPHGGGLIVDVLVGHVPRRHRRLLRRAACTGARPLAPRISPNKTVEGLLIGMVVGGAARSGSPASTRTGSRARRAADRRRAWRSPPRSATCSSR